MGTPVIEFNDVRFAWAGGQDVLLIPDWQVAEGVNLFVAGPSGSGKSTLLNLVAGIHAPTQGSVKVLGQDLARLSASQRDRFRADHMGLVFQLFNLVPYLSVLENATLPCRFSKARRERAGQPDQAARALLEELGIAHLERKRVTELSVGEQQRVAVARALVGSPQIVIADEPTSALDDTTKQAFIELLLHEANQRGATVLFVSHDLSLADHFHQTLNMEAFRPR